MYTWQVEMTVHNDVLLHSLYVHCIHVHALCTACACLHIHKMEYIHLTSYVLYKSIKITHGPEKWYLVKKVIHLLPTIVGKEYSISLDALHRHHTIRMGFTKLQRARDVVGPRICINERCGTTHLTTDPAGSREPHGGLRLIHVFGRTSVLAHIPWDRRWMYGEIHPWNMFVNC